MSAETGTRFCILHQPPAATAIRGAVVYIHPFAEEMNKSRRMAAMMSRSFAEQGLVVLQLDLYGCGDSSGELRDATLSDWIADIQSAFDWISQQGYGPVCLWGLRFGALLAVHWCRSAARVPQRLLLWQPVHSGATYLTQFLRLGVASEMLGAGGTGTGTAGLRKRLASGESVEIGGYDVSPALASDMEALQLAQPAPIGTAVDWFDISAAHAKVPSIASRQIVDGWKAQGRDVSYWSITGDPFWTTVEITDCPDLLRATLAAAISERVLCSTSER